METNFTTDATTGALQTMPFYPPRQIIELEIDAMKDLNRVVDMFINAANKLGRVGKV